MYTSILSVGVWGVDVFMPDNRVLGVTIDTQTCTKHKDVLPRQYVDQKRDISTTDTT